MCHPNGASEAAAWLPAHLPPSSLLAGTWGWARSAQRLVTSERTSLFQVSKPWSWGDRKQHRFQTAGVPRFPSLARLVNTKPLTSARLTLTRQTASQTRRRQVVI